MANSSQLTWTRLIEVFFQVYFNVESIKNNNFGVAYNFSFFYVG
jgi:hypothetical protein